MRLPVSSELRCWYCFGALGASVFASSMVARSLVRNSSSLPFGNFTRVTPISGALGRDFIAREDFEA